MTDIEINLGATISSDVCEMIHKSVFWIDSGIRAVRFNEEPSGTKLLISYDSKRRAVEVRDKIINVIRDAITTAERFPHSILYQGSTRVAHSHDAFPRLVDAGWIAEEVRGAFLYSGLMATLYQALDSWFANRFRELGARDAIFPAMVSPQTLLSTGYVKLNARQLNYVFHLREGDHSTGSLSSQVSELNLRTTRNNSDNPDVILTPAVCQPAYRKYSDSTLKETELLTSLARCFRYESGATNGLLRAREFGVREFVCIGDEEQVKAHRAKLLKLAKESIDKLDIDARLATASDPFFADVYSEYRMYQISFAVKHEIQARIPSEDSYVAVASVNYHESHFGDAWRITSIDGKTAHSCCMGFGLDRWCYTVFAQYGLSPKRWPSFLRALVL